MSTVRSVAPLSPADIAQLDELYTIRDRATVLPFLRKHSFILPLLIEGAAQARRYFPEAQLFLEFYCDFEEAALNHLVVRVASALSPDQALKQLDRLADNWWLEVIPEAQMKLDFDLERQ